MTTLANDKLLHRRSVADEPYQPWQSAFRSRRDGQLCSDFRDPPRLIKRQPSRSPSKHREGRSGIWKTSTKDKLKGSFHEMKGAIKEEVGKITDDRHLQAEGKAEKKEGKVQQKIGHAKEAVADLKDKLTELKAG